MSLAGKKKKREHLPERSHCITCVHCGYSKEIMITGIDRDFKYHCPKCFDFLWDNNQIIGWTCLCGNTLYANQAVSEEEDD